MRIKAYIFLLFCFFTISSFAQEYFVVEAILIEGNKRTKEYVVHKELDFEVGDTLFLQNLVKRLELNKNNLQNTGLFNQVGISTTDWRPGEKLSKIRINLVENWFWYPVPLIELGDRSWNEWYYQHNASLKRLNLGLRFLHINLTGNNDFLKFIYHTGFVQRYELDYTFPYLKKTNNIGSNINLFYADHKEIAYESKYNKLHFIKMEDVMLKRFRASLGFHLRPKQKSVHTLTLAYSKNTVHDTISEVLNPDFFNSGKNQIRHFSLHYHYFYNNVNLNIYPTEGNRFSLDIQKEGLNIYDNLNHLQVKAAYEHNLKLHNRYTFSTKVKFKKTLFSSKPIPYYYHTGLGYEDDVLSGYQLYVIDGINFAYITTTQKIKILENSFDFKKFMPVKQFRVLPLELYFSLHGDAAYVENKRFPENNDFTNRLLYGVGISLDLVAYYNYAFCLEFSVNHTGETGIFFQSTNSFE